MKQFEEGKTYRAYHQFLSPITVLRRMPKTLEVTNGSCSWRMRIDHDGDGNEVAADKTVPFNLRWHFTYSSVLEVK